MAFGLLMADFINKSFFKKKLENVWPFCRAKRIGRNTEVIVLLGFVRCNEISLYPGSFSYILLYLREGKLFLVPRTLLYRGSAVLINNIGALSCCKPRIPASRLFFFFFFLPILYFYLLYLVFFSFYLIIIIIIFFLKCNY